MRKNDRHLLLAGLKKRQLDLLDRLGIIEELGRENVFPSEDQWFAAMEHAIERGMALVRTHHCGDQCPLLKRIANPAS